MISTEKKKKYSYERTREEGNALQNKIIKIHIDSIKKSNKSYVTKYYCVLSIHITQELP